MLAGETRRPGRILGGMKSTLLRLLAVTVLGSTTVIAAAVNLAKPEETGMSGERLGRIRTLRMEFPNAVYQAIVD